VAAINHLWDHHIGLGRKGVTFVCGEGNEHKEFEGHVCLVVKNTAQNFVKTQKQTQKRWRGRHSGRKTGEHT